MTHAYLAIRLLCIIVVATVTSILTSRALGIQGITVITIVIMLSIAFLLNAIVPRTTATTLP